MKESSKEIFSFYISQWWSNGSSSGSLPEDGVRIARLQPRKSKNSSNNKCAVGNLILIGRKNKNSRDVKQEQMGGEDLPFPSRIK